MKKWFKIEFFDSVYHSTVNHRISYVERQYISCNQAIAMAERMAKNIAGCNGWKVTILFKL